MKEFSVEAVLTVAHDRFVCEMDQVYEILNYMTGDNLFTHQLPRAMRECKPWLLRQHPKLDAPEISVTAMGLLISMLENGDPDNGHAEWSKDGARKLVLGWLSKYVYPVLGRALSIEPIPKDDHDIIDPITEAVNMVGKDRVIAIKTD